MLYNTIIVFTLHLVGVPTFTLEPSYLEHLECDHVSSIYLAATY